MQDRLFFGDNPLEIVTPRASIQLSEKTGAISFTQRDLTCVFPRSYTAFRFDDGWHIECRDTYEHSFFLPRIVPPGRVALLICAMLTLWAEEEIPTGAREEQ